jgi:hypothetical protein
MSTTGNLILTIMCFLLTIGITIGSCEYKKDNSANNIKEKDDVRDKFAVSIIGVTRIEGCEYFILDTYGTNSLVHKGNCNNPIHIYNKPN